MCFSKQIYSDSDPFSYFVRYFQPLEIFHLNVQSFEVVSRYRNAQHQVTENICDL